MSITGISKEDILKFAEPMNFGFYRVTKDGVFVECDSEAKKIFGIPRDATINISQYSITKMYAVEKEREWRIQRLEENECLPLCSTLSLRIKGEDILLFDICWCDCSESSETYYSGIVLRIEEGRIFPKMFDSFPVGLYEVDDNNCIVRVNGKMLKIFRFSKKSDLLGKNIEELYEDKNQLKKLTGELQKQGFSHDVLTLRDANKELLEIECFSQNVEPFKFARWGMMIDVTKRERYYRALDRLPTGYYHIEHEKTTDCNDQFAHIIGFERKEQALKKDTRDYFADEKAGEKYFKELKKADKNNEGAVYGYELPIKRVNDGEIRTISIDSHFVRNPWGEVIGREGTIRDITDKVELTKKVKEAEKNLEKTTADINQLIHTFLHPVIKFSGNSHALQRISEVLKKAANVELPSISSPKLLGEELIGKVTEVVKNIPDLNKVSYEEEKIRRSAGKLELVTAKNLEEKLTKTIYKLDYELQTEKSSFLLENSILDATIEILELLAEIGYFDNKELRTIITEEFVKYMQGILYKQLLHGTSLLQDETEMMKREVEALRANIGLKKERQYVFQRRDIGQILEENIERFRQAFLENGIEIDYNSKGDLSAEISANDIDRVVCNLFNNVRKYSLGRKKRVGKIRAKEKQPENIVHIFIQSYGIPIKKEEIENGKIWTVGYRSEFAYATDRDGTGVGLADAKEVVEAHHGKISISSEPVRDDGAPPEYKVPYLTTVNISIPKNRR